MPPFPNQQNSAGSFPMQQNQTGSFNPAQVQRFPLPFVSPFLPPPPQLMHSGNGPLLPGMVPPWPPSTVGMGIRPPFVPPSTGESGSRETNSNLQTDPTPTSQDERTNTDSSSTTANTHEDPEIQQLSQDSHSTERASPDEDPSLRSRNTGLRRRLASSLQTEERASLQTEERSSRTASSTQSQSVRTPERPRPSESLMYYVFVSTIILAILLLVLRRLYIMKILPVHF